MALCLSGELNIIYTHNNNNNTLVLLNYTFFSVVIPHVHPIGKKPLSKLAYTGTSLSDTLCSGNDTSDPPVDCSADGGVLESLFSLDLSAGTVYGTSSGGSGSGNGPGGLV